MRSAKLRILMSFALFLTLVASSGLVFSDDINNPIPFKIVHERGKKAIEYCQSLTLTVWDIDKTSVYLH